MSHRVLSTMLALFLLLPTVDSLRAPDEIPLGSMRSIGDASKVVHLASRSGQSFAVSLDSLRTRFCREGNTGPCYDYTVVYVHFDNCGVSAYPLSAITKFESKGEFRPSFCIPATQAATLSTKNETGRKVYLQDLYWSLVGTEISTGETVVLPFGEISSLYRR